MAGWIDGVTLDSTGGSIKIEDWDSSSTAAAAGVSLVLVDGNVQVWDEDGTLGSSDRVIGWGSLVTGSSYGLASFSALAEGYAWNLSSESIGSFQGTEGNDKFILTAAASNASLVTTTGNDKVQFASTGAQTFVFSGNLAAGNDLTISNTNTSVMLAGASTVNGAVITGSVSGGLTMDGAAVTLGSGSTLSKGSFTMNENGNSDITFDVTGGSLNLGGSGGNTLKAVNVSGGEIYLGASTNDVITSLEATGSGVLNFGAGGDVSLTAQASSAVSKGAYGTGVLTLTDSDSTLTLSEANVAKSFSIDLNSNGRGTHNLDVDTIAAGQTLTVTVGGTAKVDLAEVVGSLKAIDSSTNNEISLQKGVVDLTTSNSGNIFVESTSALDVVASNLKGDVEIDRGTTTTNDTVSVAFGAGAYTGTFNLGGGADSLKIASTNAASSATLSLGAGDDVLDLSELASNNTTGTVVIDDFGWNKSRSAAGDNTTRGKDTIYFGEAGSLNTAKKSDIKLDDSDSDYYYTTINGVKINLGENDGTARYIQIQEGDDTAVVYQVTKDTGLVAVGDATSSNEDYPFENAAADEEISLNQTEAGKTATKDATGSMKSKDLTDSFGENDDGTKRKYLNVASDAVITDGTVKMGNQPTNYLLFDKDAAPTVSVDLGTSNAVVGTDNSGVDLSKVSISHWDSTKDLLIGGGVVLSDYLPSEGQADTTRKAGELINGESGLYGTNIVADSGTLASNTKGGLYQTRFREGVDDGSGKLGSSNGEVLLAVGSTSEAGAYDFTKSTTPVFALLDQNDQKDSVKGSANNDYFVTSDGDTVDGGKGDDLIALNGGKGVVKLATKGEGADVVRGYKVGTSGGIIEMASGMSAKDIVLTGGFGTAGTKTKLSLTDGSTDGAGATVETTTNAGASSIVMRIKDEDGTKTAFVADTANNNTVQVGAGTQQQTDYDLYVGVKDNYGTLDFGDLTKKYIYLGHTEDKGTEFGDNSMYSNIRKVKSSSNGQSVLFGGSNQNVTLEAGGVDDSIWGGGYSKNDSLVSYSGGRTNFGTAGGSGKDTISGFLYGANAAEEGENTDVLYLVGGFGYYNVNNKQFIVGSSASDNVTFEETNSNVREINFALGLNAPILTAQVDLSETGTNLTFSSNDQIYLGQGSKSGLVFNDEEAVKFGYASSFGAINVGTLNGKAAAAGSIINGSNGLSQTVYASTNGPSWIGGGFDGEFKNADKDTLVGGGNGDTTFVVGKDMGNDVLTNVSDGDTIVFLNTKVSDMSFTLNSDKNATAKVADGATLEIKASDNTRFSATTGITAQFTDGTYVFNGSTWAPKA